MAVSFCVLGSGSSGNAALFLTPQAHVLIDAGFTLDELARRMEGTGATWETLTAVLLTHTHGDHVKATCLREFAKRGIPFYCHPEHQQQLRNGRYLKHVAERGCLRAFEAHEALELPGGVRCEPLPVPHDCPPTFGFRLEAQDGGGQLRRLVYLADLGHWTRELAERVRDVDLLALEFNHDEEMERASGRSQHLIDRVLGLHGHLSNRQAAEALASVLRASGAAHPRQLVQLHLSEECNRRELAFRLAVEAAREAGLELEVHTSRQDRRGSVHAV